MSYFLRHFAGFFIQIGTGAMLCLLPFSGDNFRYPKKRVMFGFGIMVLFASLGYPLVRELMTFVKFENMTILSNVYMLFVMIGAIILYFCVIQAETVKKLIVLTLVMFYEATQYLLVNLASPLFPQGILPDAYPPLILALYTGTALVMFPAAVFLMIKIVGVYLEEVEIQNIKHEFNIVLIVTVLYFLMLFLYSSRPNVDIAAFWWWVTPPFLLTAVILCFFYWILFRESVRRKRDSEYQKTMEIQQICYKKITEEMEKSRRIRHDMRHYLNGLYTMLEENTTAEMKIYLANIISNTSNRENQIYCGNTTVNALLQYYVGQAQSEGIRCKVRADCGELSVAPEDLTVLLGNAMENAIHACRKFESDRWIAVRAGVVGGSFALEIKNPCQGIHMSGKCCLDGNFHPASAFLSERAGGGYGLRSLEHTAQKYGGNASFRFDENEKIFITRIRLNLHLEML